MILPAPVERAPGRSRRASASAADNRTSHPVNSTPQPPPGPKGRRLHNFRQRMTNYTEFLDGLRREHGEIVSFELPFMNCCVVFDAELIREVLVTQQAWFRPWWPGDFTDERKYGGIALKQGEEQRRRGEFMAAAFAADAEGVYAEIVARRAARMRDRLLSRQTVNLVEEFDRFAWDAIVEIVLGQGVELPLQLCEDTLSLAQSYMLLSILPGGKLLKSMPLPALRNGRKSRDLVDETLYAAMQRAREDGYSGTDMITKYVRAMDLEDPAAVLDCDEAIGDELIALLVTQIDGPTSTLAFGVHYLARNPDIRARVEREVDTVLNGRHIEGADFDRLPYTNALLKEVLRIDPPTEVCVPKEATEDRMLGGHLVRKGTLVHVAMRALHHEPRYWDGASDFRPERWLENGRPTCPAHAYIPFGLGPHSCQGMEVGRRLFVFGIAALTQSMRLAPRSADPPKRNDIAVGVVGPWMADVHERPETTRHDPREQVVTESKADSARRDPAAFDRRDEAPVLLARTMETIEADPEAVFATLAHGGRHGDAIPEVESVEFVSDQRMGLGARFRENRKLNAAEALFFKLLKLYRNVIECTEFEPSRRVRYVSDGAGALWHSIYTLTPVDKGRTQVELRLETRPRNLLGRRLPPLLKKPLQEVTENDLKAIKAHIEGAEG